MHPTSKHPSLTSAGLYHPPLSPQVVGANASKSPKWPVWASNHPTVQSRKCNWKFLYQVGYPSALRWSIFHCSSPIPQPPNHARQGTKKFVAQPVGVACRWKNVGNLVGNWSKTIQGSFTRQETMPLSSQGHYQSLQELPGLIQPYRSLTNFPMICLLFQSIQVPEM